MKAVLRRELHHLFRHMRGWTMTACMLACFSAACIAAIRIGTSFSPEQTVRLGTVSYFLIAVFCAANGFSPERQGGTERLLRSLPVSSAKVVLGKLCAYWIAFLVGCGLLCVYPVVLHVLTGCPMGGMFACLGLYSLAGLAVVTLSVWISMWTTRPYLNALIAVLLLGIALASGRIASFLLSTSFAYPAALVFTALLVFIAAFRATRDHGWALCTALVIELGLLLLLNGRPASIGAFWNGFSSALGLFAIFASPVYGVLPIRSVAYCLLLLGALLCCAVCTWKNGILYERGSAE